jgi:hypothetical protein
MTARQETIRPTGDAVWAYWEDVPGRSRSAYLDLCLETIKQNADGMEVHVMNREDVRSWLPDLDLERWERLPAPNYRSDYVRSRVLYLYGGVWADIDTVAVAPLTGLLEELDGTGTVCWGTELGRCFTNLCVARPGAPFVEAWARQQDETLSRTADWSRLNYSALAQDITWGLAERLPWKAVPMRRVAPVPWYEWRRFLSRLESPRRILKGSPITVVLWNAIMQAAFGPMSSDRLLGSPVLLGRLLRIGLGLSNWEQEEDSLTRLHFLSDLRFSTRGQGVEINARRAFRAAKHRSMAPKVT